MDYKEKMYWKMDTGTQQNGHREAVWRQRDIREWETCQCGMEGEYRAVERTNLSMHSSEQGIWALMYMQNGICPALFLAYYPDCNVSTAILIILIHKHTPLRNAWDPSKMKNVSMSVSSGQKTSCCSWHNSRYWCAVSDGDKIHHRPWSGNQRHSRDWTNI